MIEKLALLEKREAEDMAVNQFTDMYNTVNEKELDISKLELIIRNVFAAGALWKGAVMAKEYASHKTYEDGLNEMRDKAMEAFLDCEGYDEFDAALDGAYME